METFNPILADFVKGRVNKKVRKSLTTSPVPDPRKARMVLGKVKAAENREMDCVACPSI